MQLDSQVSILIPDSRLNITESGSEVGNRTKNGIKKERCVSVYAGTGQDSGFPFLSEGTDPEIGEHIG